MYLRIAFASDYFMTQTWQSTISDLLEGIHLHFFSFSQWRYTKHYSTIVALKFFRIRRGEDEWVLCDADEKEYTPEVSVTPECLKKAGGLFLLQKRVVYHYVTLKETIALPTQVESPGSANTEEVLEEGHIPPTHQDEGEEEEDGNRSGIS